MKKGKEALREMRVHSLVAMVGLGYADTAALNLIEKEGERIVVIYIGIFEAQAIMLGLKGLSIKRPLTHDLIFNTMNLLGAKIDKVVVTRLVENTFYADIHITREGEKKVIDSRPSDAVALAVKFGSPIFMDDDLFSRVGMTEEQIRQKNESTEKEIQLLRSLKGGGKMPTA